MTAVPSIRYTLEEYLQLEQSSGVKHDYFDGAILDMSGGSVDHSGITTNLIIEFGHRLKGAPCRVFESNLRVCVQKGAIYTYPDLMIVRGPSEHDPLDKSRTTIVNPTVVFEVLSPGTEAYDRGEKFKRYRNLASLREYILVSSNEPSIDAFAKGASGQWSLVGFDGLEATLKLRSMDIEVPLADIYAGVSFAANANLGDGERP